MVDIFTSIDLVCLALFLIFFSIFLYTRKHNLKKEGLFFLYRTKWGIKAIDYLGDKYKRTLSFLSYVSIACGYLLMVGVLYLIYTIVKIYLFSPAIVKAIKVPPIIPLVHYLPQVFKLQFLPPFYFTYWIVILAVIAISHEMAHGIFMRRYKIKIKSTGFAFFPWFFPVFPAAFVEQNEKSMNKAKKFHQLSVLSAGTFANVITAILFLVILFGFFSLAFSSSGVIFDSYATSAIAISGISMINGVPLNNASYGQIINLASDSGFNNITFQNQNYLATKNLLEDQPDAEATGGLIVYDDAPAIRNNISSIITEINGIPITSLEKLQTELYKYNPGDTITLTTKTDTGFIEQQITLEENPRSPGTPWLGIGFYSNAPTNFLGRIINKLAFKDPHTYYAPKFNGVSIFVYNLLWWIVIISISVALINMLPMGVFDGGKFFYLTILGLTKNEKFARRVFAFMTWFFLFLLVVLMVYWFFRVF